MKEDLKLSEMYMSKEGLIKALKLYLEKLADDNEHLIEAVKEAEIVLMHYASKADSRMARQWLDKYGAKG